MLTGGIGNGNVSLYYSQGPGTVKTASGEYVDENSSQAKALKRSGQVKCETCAERKYQDGSDEMVSFKAATHISPQGAAGAVRAHEQEHVSNAYAKAGKEGGRVMQASVRIKTAICPECGRGYVSGGLTTTKIKYDGKDENIKDALKGNFFDSTV